MKLKTKDIVTMIISLIFIGGSIYFMFKILSPKKPKETKTETERTVEEAKKLDVNIDNKSLEKVESLTDYGKPTLENIGKTDIFSPAQ